MLLRSLPDIESLISSKIQESTSLEYKAALAIENKAEISRDVSSFSNASGGVIIYGVAEYQQKDKAHLPEKIDPISSNCREYLDQVINSTIKPKITAQIYPIEITGRGFIYIVEIPQGDTAHQANDYRYYRRYNFQRLPMEHYEIRDIMNRMKNPRVSLDFEAVRRIARQADGKNLWNLSLRPYLCNQSRILAKYVRYKIKISRNAFPRHVPDYLVEEDDFYLLEGTNKDFGVIHPGSKIVLPEIKSLNTNSLILVDGDFFIEWLVHADNADINSGQARIFNLKRVEEELY